MAYQGRTLRVPVKRTRDPASPWGYPTCRLAEDSQCDHKQLIQSQRSNGKLRGVLSFLKCFLYLCLCVCGVGCVVCHCICVEVRGQILTLHHMDLGMELRLLALDLHLLGQPASPGKVYL